MFLIAYFNLLNFPLRKMKLIWFLFISLPSFFLFFLYPYFWSFCFSKDTTDFKQQNYFNKYLILRLLSIVSIESEYFSLSFLVVLAKMTIERTRNKIPDSWSYNVTTENNAVLKRNLEQFRIWGERHIKSVLNLGYRILIFTDAVGQ